MILITGGAGFIGGNFVLDWLAQCDEPVINLDKLTYAGNLEKLAPLQGDPRHTFVQGDIGDRALVEQLLHTCRDAAWTLSDRIGLRYFNHSDVFGQSVGSR